MGINVKRIGYISFLYSGVLCGLGGAFMSMGLVVSFFMKNMVNGRGYIGLSAMNIAEGGPVDRPSHPYSSDSQTPWPPR